MVHAPSRPEAIIKIQAALAGTALKGVTTNLEFLGLVAADRRYAAGETTTRFVEGIEYWPHATEVLDPGLQTTVQDWPGRVAMWSVGVPPSGPMDDLSHRTANALVGNNDSAAALEVTLAGPTLKVHADVLVAVCGAPIPVTVDGIEAPMWTGVAVKRGQTLKVGGASSGARAYVAISGGIDVPEYLGSRSTFPGGKMGGHQGRALVAGDMLPLAPMVSLPAAGAAVPASWRPGQLAGPCAEWVVGVLPGPQAAPDYFLPEDMDVFYSSSYKVHHNSNRLGVRLEGPKPSFARPDGGEGGSHPSNVHDHVYAIGAINFTGDMPVVLTVDGPSLGGFVCPATIATTELWKMGQVRPGEIVRFRKMTIEEVRAEHTRVFWLVFLPLHLSASPPMLQGPAALA
jgi:urea carboxylase